MFVDHDTWTFDDSKKKKKKKLERTFVCKRESITESVRTSVHEQLPGPNQRNKQKANTHTKIQGIFKEVKSRLPNK